MLSRRIRAAASILAAVAPCAAAPAQLFYVDFENLPEGTAVRDQYAHLGVTFSIERNPEADPVIAVEGSPMVAFLGLGDDAPMSRGHAGLTDPLVEGASNVGQNIAMTFDPPVTRVRFYVIDIDSADVMTARAFAGQTEVDAVTRTAGEAGTGDAVSTEFVLAGDGITYVVLEVPETVGYAIDALAFRRTCDGPRCGPVVRVAQESAPGAGDFDVNCLGEVRPVGWAGTVAELYAYDQPVFRSWSGPAFRPRPDRSHLLLASAADGLGLIVVHDGLDNPDGGRAEMTVEIVGDRDGAERVVEDGPGGETIDTYTGNPGDVVFTSVQAWTECCTDGFALAAIDCPATVVVGFADADGNETTPAIEGLTAWTLLSADGSEIDLALEPDRRVRLQIMPDPRCPADLDCSGTVDFADVMRVLQAWGSCPDGP